MTDTRRLRGLTALLGDAIEHGSRAVERVHLATANRPFAVLELIEGVAAPARIVHIVYDAAVKTTYEAVRVANRAVGAAIEAALDVVEAKGVETETETEAPPPGRHPPRRPEYEDRLPR